MERMASRRRGRHRVKARPEARARAGDHPTSTTYPCASTRVRLIIVEAKGEAMVDDRFYELTAAGRRRLETQRSEWARLTAVVGHVLGTGSWRRCATCGSACGRSFTGARWRPRWRPSSAADRAAAGGERVARGARWARRAGLRVRRQRRAGAAVASQRAARRSRDPERASARFHRGCCAGGDDRLRPHARVAGRARRPDGGPRRRRTRRQPRSPAAAPARRAGDRRGGARAGLADRRRSDDAQPRPAAVRRSRRDHGSGADGVPRPAVRPLRRCRCEAAVLAAASRGGRRLAGGRERRARHQRPLVEQPLAHRHLDRGADVPGGVAAASRRARGEPRIRRRAGAPAAGGACLRGWRSRRRAGGPRWRRRSLSAPAPPCCAAPRPPAPRSPPRRPAAWRASPPGCR